jgi:hypothetical protein
MLRPMLVLCCLSVLASGCGGSNQPPTLDQEQEGSLIQVGEMYRSFQMTKNKPPVKFSDFITVRAVSGNGYEAVQSGKVVLRYGATLPDTKEEPGQSTSDEVLAYEKQVPESGGKVLLLNRTVKTMTPEEFKAAKLAGTESSKPETAKSKPK